jgi:CBS domain-containing protein
MTKTIRDILGSKGNEVYTIGANANVYEALEKMAEKNIGALVVMDEGKIVGILSERDYARKVILHGRSSLQTPIDKIMTKQVCYALLSHSVEECLAIITEKRCRHLPVFDGSNLVGIVSIGDLVKASIEEKEFMINQLENYIKAG